MTASPLLQEQQFPATQHIIGKYQEHLLEQIVNNEDASPKKRRIAKANLQELNVRQWQNRVGANAQRKILREMSSLLPETEHRQGILSRCKSLLYQLFVGDYEKRLLIEQIITEKQHAMCYEDWCEAGLRLDALTEATKWKQQEESTLYDYQLVKTLTLKMREARHREDYAQLLYIVRSTWVRNLGNMGNVNLYRHSHLGTKFLIDEYMEESRLALEALSLQSDLDDNYLLGILQQTRRNIGRSALVLSGGGTFGLFHIGVLATLFELDLLPRVISGSSAGAIVASILSVHHKDEIPELFDRVFEREFNIFTDDKRKSESENFLIKISRFLKNGTWFDNKQLVKTMVSFLGDLTFREAYNRTGKILNITVSPASLFEQPRLLNNLTAPNVLIWSAVCASCSLPGIFPSSPLYEKDPRNGSTREWGGSSSVKFVDGSVDNDLPISRLSEMFNVDHVIACQVNVHIFPFLKLSLSCVGGDIEDEFSARLKQGLSRMYSFMANEAIHVLELGCELEVANNLLTKLRSVLSQQYSGDVTILPDMKQLLRFNELLANPSKGFLLRETVNGARATWPKVSIIQNHCGQEFALDNAITFLKGKIIVNSSIKNPLQFVDNIPCGLIRVHNRKKGKNHMREESLQTSHELDDNLFEAESVKSMLPMREHSSAYVNHRTDGKANLPMSASPTSLKHHIRRNSETSARTKHSSKSLTLPMSTSLSHIRRGTVDCAMTPHTPQKLLQNSGSQYHPLTDQPRTRIDSAPFPHSPNDSPLSKSNSRPHVNKTHKSFPDLGQDFTGRPSGDASFETTPKRPHAINRAFSERGMQETGL
ncbi:BN860_00628g1_1 [Zygosaccharomyces bailii CLIB 213]|uniref:Patatin-like phospholipase domain-containing protein n=1 Tax=Zygosaccharomyces bailii (strain CLIB 213 / ATCC 58445 / CBS 680 / BCRC 21525 / NBRC 1098 / NCYC 1416 / NRRL Y-2227) TaxID=1333698 RepID=A0A8J2WTR5_ZYGB2|nr:BN860_00628g1_1 [Zygosaccharomyces bailii CLIB 213]